MSGIRTNAAAVMLGVSPNTLRSWERRFGYPSPGRTSGGHRQYDLAEIEALKQAFEETQNVSSAISIARQRGAGPPSSNRLSLALARFEEDKAARLLEESLAIRSLERTIGEVLLPAVGELRAEDPGSPEHSFAWRFATDWLSSLRRVAAPASRDEGVLISDATAPGDLEALQVPRRAAHAHADGRDGAGATRTRAARAAPAGTRARRHARVARRDRPAGLRRAQRLPGDRRACVRRRAAGHRR
jgi:DNA-binding transcriptional MerR regulator